MILPVALIVEMGFHERRESGGSLLAIRTARFQLQQGAKPAPSVIRSRMLFPSATRPFEQIRTSD